MAIMRVQKALIDDEISEKKARLLLYSIHLASVNLKHTTFTSKDKKDVVTEMVESPTASGSQTRSSRVIAEIGKQASPLICTDDTDNTNSKSQTLPRINADGRGSGKRLPRLPEAPNPNLTTETQRELVIE
jgi:hypothetical protein